MRRVDISLAVIKQGEQYLLQKRDDNPMIGAAGLIGCFGGKIEAGEQSNEAICRELAEETSLQPSLQDIESIGDVQVVADHKMEPVEVHARIFKTTVNVDQEVTANEGELMSMTITEIRANLGYMTPATKACFEQFVIKED